MACITCATERRDVKAGFRSCMQRSLTGFVDPSCFLRRCSPNCFQSIWGNSFSYFLCRCSPDRLASNWGNTFVLDGWSSIIETKQKGRHCNQIRIPRKYGHVGGIVSLSLMCGPLSKNAESFANQPLADLLGV